MKFLILPTYFLKMFMKDDILSVCKHKKYTS